MFLLVIAFGIAFLLVSIKAFQQSHELLKRGQRAEAVVTEIRSTTWYNANTDMVQGFQAIYSYTDPAGDEHQVPGSRKFRIRVL
ncbi:MAG: DUF3592 domain-containing protein [Lysobacterales bacterium]